MYMNTFAFSCVRYTRSIRPGQFDVRSSVYFVKFNMQRVALKSIFSASLIYGKYIETVMKH